MEDTLLIGLSQQMASRRSMEVIANNLANLATPAFKRETVQFEEYIAQMPVIEGDSPAMGKASFVLDRGVVRDLGDGRVEPTGEPLDLAITGAGYFVIQTADGERYTRNGHFRLDATGRLVNDKGDPVMADGGEVRMTPEDGPINVGGDGMISTALQQVGRLRVVSFADERTLKKAGDSLYTADGQTPQATLNPRVRQGMLEKSNVEPVIEISRMIEVMRAYQAGADMTDRTQDLLKRALEKLANVPQG